MKEFAAKFSKQYDNYPVLIAKDSKYANVEFALKTKFVIFRPHQRMYTWEEQYQFIVHQIRTHIIKQVALGKKGNYDELMFSGYFEGHSVVTDKFTNKEFSVNTVEPSISMYVEYTHPPAYMEGIGIITLPNAFHAEDIAVSEIYETTDQHFYIDYHKVILSGVNGETEKFYDRVKMNRITGEFSMEGYSGPHPEWLDYINCKNDLYQNPNNRPAWHKVFNVNCYDGISIFIDWDNKLCYLNTEFGWTCMALDYARNYIKHSELDAAVNIKAL
jgi:hypothetical protein